MTDIDVSPRIQSGVNDGTTGAMDDGLWTWYEELVPQLAASGARTLRFSIERARVEPRPDEFNPLALQRYRSIVECCRRHGIEPVITLRHFTEPAWMTARGGPRARRAPAEFARYATAVARVLAAPVALPDGTTCPGVETWLTCNEPVSEGYLRYLNGDLPPHSRNDVVGAVTYCGALLELHVAGYNALHSIAEQLGVRARVSLSFQYRAILPLSKRLLDRADAALWNHLSVGAWLDRLANPRVGTRMDFFALQYYSVERVEFDPRAPLLTNRVLPGADEVQSAYGWRLQPEGLHDALVDVHRRFPELPILVTELGWSDNANHPDTARRQFYVQHLAVIARAIAEGIPVEGAMAWTVYDNWEWAEGWQQRFGVYDLIVERGPEGPRHLLVPRSSGRFLEAVASSHAIPAAELAPEPRALDAGRRYFPGWLRQQVRGVAEEPSPTEVSVEVVSPSAPALAMLAVHGTPAALEALVRQLTRRRGWRSAGVGAHLRIGSLQVTRTALLRDRGGWPAQIHVTRPFPTGAGAESAMVVAVEGGSAAAIDLLVEDLWRAAKHGGAGLHGDLQVETAAPPHGPGGAQGISSVRLIGGRPGVLSLTGSPIALDNALRAFHRHRALQHDGTFGQWGEHVPAAHPWARPRSGRRVLYLRPIPGGNGRMSTEHTWGSAAEPPPLHRPAHPLVGQVLEFVANAVAFSFPAIARIQAITGRSHAHLPPTRLHKTPAAEHASSAARSVANDGPPIL